MGWKHWAGAENAVFIERNAVACSVITKLADLQLSDKAAIVRDTVSALKPVFKGKIFDIIFMDPPYFKNQIETTLGILRDTNMVKSIVVVQHPQDELFKFNGFSCYKHRRYGRTALTFLAKE